MRKSFGEHQDKIEERENTAKRGRVENMEIEDVEEQVKIREREREREWKRERE